MELFSDLFVQNSLFKSFFSKYEFHHLFSFQFVCPKKFWLLNIDNRRGFSKKYYPFSVKLCENIIRSKREIIEYYFLESYVTCQTLKISQHWAMVHLIFKILIFIEYYSIESYKSVPLFQWEIWFITSSDNIFFIENVIQNFPNKHKANWFSPCI